MTIPKIIFQTSPFKPPTYLLERIQQKCINWEYNHFLDDDIIDFIEKHPIESLYWDYIYTIQKYSGLRDILIPQRTAATNEPGNQAGPDAVNDFCFWH
jgi:hypothetical protein